VQQRRPAAASFFAFAKKRRARAESARIPTPGPISRGGGVSIEGGKTTRVPRKATKKEEIRARGCLNDGGIRAAPDGPIKETKLTRRTGIESKITAEGKENEALFPIAGRERTYGLLLLSTRDSLYIWGGEGGGGGGGGWLGGTTGSGGRGHSLIFPVQNHPEVKTANKGDEKGAGTDEKHEGAKKNRDKVAPR